MRLRRFCAALLVGVLAGLGLVLGPAGAPAQAAGCSGVWVVVGRDVRCATSYNNGLTALRSAGFSVQTLSGFICRIDGAPETCTDQAPYWSYWHASRRADGSWGPWRYSTLGAVSFHPQRGDAEGWTFGDGTTPPSVRPPVVRATTTTTTTTTAPPASTSRPASTSTSTTSSSAPAARPTTSAPPAPSASASGASPTPSASATVSPSSPAPSAASSVPTEAPTPGAAPAPAPEPAGTPIATLGVLGALAAAGGVVWAVLRRRRS